MSLFKLNPAFHHMYLHWLKKCRSSHCYNTQLLVYPHCLQWSFSLFGYVFWDDTISNIPTFLLAWKSCVRPHTLYPYKRIVYSRPVLFLYDAEAGAFKTNNHCNVLVGQRLKDRDSPNHPWKPRQQRSAATDTVSRCSERTRTAKAYVHKHTHRHTCGLWTPELNLNWHPGHREGNKGLPAWSVTPHYVIMYCYVGLCNSETHCWGKNTPKQNTLILLCVCRHVWETAVQKWQS